MVAQVSIGIVARNGMSAVPNMKIPTGCLEDISVCPVCRGTIIATLHENLRDYNFGIIGGDWTMRQCQDCRTAFLSPRLNKQNVGLAYAGNYYTHESHDEVPKGLAITRLIKRGICNDYLNKRLGSNGDFSLPLGALLVHRCFPRRRAKFEHQLRSLNRDLGTRILDVGCGNGAFIHGLRQRGWTTYGVEPDPVAIEICLKRGLAVSESLEPIPDRCVDWVTMDHVIEHVHDPVGILRDCARVLKPGGRIWLATPNIEAKGHQRFGPDWFALDPPRHLYVFSAKALNLLLDAAGFVEVMMKSPYQGRDWLYKWSNGVRSKRGAGELPESKINQWLAEDEPAPDAQAGELVFTAATPATVV